MRQLSIIIFMVCIIAYTCIQAKQSLLGKKAPLFTGQAILPDGSNATLHLKDYKHQNVVIYFYPMDNSPVCTLQAKKFRDEFSRLNERNIMVIGISPDSIESHLKFHTKLNLPYPLIADVDRKHSISKKYNTHGFLFNKRQTFLINKKGIIFKIFQDIDINNQINDIIDAFTAQS